MAKPREFVPQEVLMQLSQPWGSVRDDLTAYDNFIDNLGIRYQHWISMPYIVGATDTSGIRDYDSFRTETNDNFIYDNGFMYKFAGIVIGITQSNGQSYQQIAAGMYPDSSAYVTFSKFYKDDDRTIVRMSEYDKLIPCEDCIEIPKVNFEKIDHNPTGIDRLQFQAVDVLWLVDANGREYKKGTDFELINGEISWKPDGQRPGFSSTISKPLPYSVRYLYKPSFYIKHLIHDLRVHPTFDANGETRTQSGPVQAMIQMDFAFLDSLKQGDGNNPDTFRSAPEGENEGPG